jgi:hypothetical protein
VAKPPLGGASKRTGKKNRVQSGVCQLPFVEKSGTSRLFPVAVVPGCPSPENKSLGTTLHLARGNIHQWLNAAYAPGNPNINHD